MFIYSGKKTGKPLDNIYMSCYIIPMPFKPIEPEKVKNKFWRFRVNPYEFQLLEWMGTPVQWRKFCLGVAQMYSNIQSGILKHPSGEPYTLEEMDFAHFIKRVFEEGVNEDEPEP